jgi:hypothetical protein
MSLPTDPSSDDIRAKIAESTALSEIIALMKDNDEGVRQAAVNTISSLAGRRMNFLRAITTN